MRAPQRGADRPGIAAVENAFGCGNLYDEHNFGLLTALQDSLHAHVLLRRDVDYVVKNGAIEMVDEFKGRIALRPPLAGRTPYCGRGQGRRRGQAPGNDSGLDYAAHLVAFTRKFAA